MKMVIDNDGDAIMLDATQIKCVKNTVVGDTEVSFDIVYYVGEDANICFEFASYSNLSKEIVIANIEQIRNDIILFLNGNTKPEPLVATIDLSK